VLCGEAGQLLDEAVQPSTYTSLDYGPRAEAHVVACTLVPQVFLGNRFIGGYTQLKTYLELEQHLRT
jgi:glutaredoxin